jgi:hypothetical protein
LEVRFTTNGSPRWGWLPLGFASYFHNHPAPTATRQKPENPVASQPQTFAADFFLKKVDFFALFFSLTGRTQLFRFTSPQAS